MQMKFCSEKNKVSGNMRNIYSHKEYAFTLFEVIIALAILALVSSSVLVVIDRCVASMADSTLQMQAFEVARELLVVVLAGCFEPPHRLPGGGVENPGRGELDRAVAA